VKPGLDLNVFSGCLAREAISGILYGRWVSRSAGRDRAVAVGPDGGRLDGAAAHRQFRLGRYHLDLLAWAGSAPNARQWLVAALVAIWSIRLGAHIAVRTSAISDDPRYAAFAKEWGVDSPRKMFIFLQNQGFGSIPLVFAIFVAARFPQDALRLQDYLGVLILFIGIAGEALADAQLKNFRNHSANKGQVCDAGLWRWSRHPNYFFEWFGWLAYPVIALSLDYPWCWATLLAPVFMYWILVHVTGIPPLEAQMLRSRGERYRDYQSRTSMFFPLPPHKETVP
jgi:steroid 5-alpha reductase family enzyme